MDLPDWQLPNGFLPYPEANLQPLVTLRRQHWRANYPHWLRLMILFTKRPRGSSVP